MQPFSRTAFFEAEGDELALVLVTVSEPGPPGQQ